MLFQERISKYCNLAIVTCMLATPVFAVNCGDTVSGTVTLTGDLSCSGPGLIVGGSNTLIDLNGYTISCSGAGGGYLGSCQKSVTTANTLSVVGIASTGHSHVEVRGPGTITGFGVGVRLSTGADLNVDGVTITGPTAPVSTDFTLARALTVGVLIDQTSCVVATLAPSFAGVVEFNDISNQTMGVQLSGASCVLVTGNNIHDNAGAQGDSHGIDLIASGNNVISTNIVTRNGANLGVNGGVDGGIMLLNSTSAQNHVWFNYVTNNCGDGITIRNSAHDNNVEGNTALNNSTSTLGGRCVKVQPGTFFDVADRNEGAGNVWNPNNTCKTQGPGIPNGVCP